MLFLLYFCKYFFVLLTPSLVLAQSYDDNVTCYGVEIESVPSEESRASKQIHHLLRKITIPPKFDAREKWPFCRSLKTVLYQGSCGGCWAFAAATVMSDRLCIATDGKFNELLSTQDLMECCEHCVVTKGGCSGGDSWKSFVYWEKTGLVSRACKPLHQGITRRLSIKKCRKFCTTNNHTLYRLDKKFSVASLYLKPDGNEDLKHIQAEIMLNGPVVASMEVYKYIKISRPGDILIYDRKKVGKGGIYAKHAIRVIGWDVVDKVPVWIVANSWGTRWCNKGFCHIRRGKNDFGLERMTFKTGIASVKDGVPLAHRGIDEKTSQSAHVHLFGHVFPFVALYLIYFSQ